MALSRKGDKGRGLCSQAVCHQAQRNIASPWPLNNKVAPLTMFSGSDTDDEVAQFTITAVIPDQLVHVCYDRNFSPSDLIQSGSGSEAQLLVGDRSGSGNRGIYTFNFTARDRLEICRNRAQDRVRLISKKKAVGNARRIGST